MIEKDKVFIIGSGPIIIGQACEFDYSGTQACKAVHDLGYEVVLINSNPATIMTDHLFADKAYICPIDLNNIIKILKKEKPKYLLAAFGGQTALNLVVKLQELDILEKLNIKILGTNIDTIIKTEDRFIFRDIMKSLNISLPKRYDDIKDCKFPVVVRSTYTLGGLGATLCKNKKELIKAIKYSKKQSMNDNCIIEQSIYGWQELEVEIVRDIKGNKLVVCYIENIDPVGIHTGDSVCVSPFISIPKLIENKIKELSFKIVDKLNIIGACNIQFAYNKYTDELLIIEINARTSRSSALASKATGFPIAYFTTKLSFGKTLKELKLLKYKPSDKYVAVKVPHFDFDKFDKKDHNLGMSMKSIGESLTFGKTFKEAYNKIIDNTNNIRWIKIPVCNSKNKYYYSSCNTGKDKIKVSKNKKILIIGSGPNRIGQGIEFDYSCVHAVLRLKALGYETIMLNNNPETVSTDADIADKLYFDPINIKNVLKIYNLEKPEGILVQFGGQTSLNILKQLEDLNINILGINIDILSKTEDRDNFKVFMNDLNIPIPIGIKVNNIKEARNFIKTIKYPIIARPSYIIGGSGIKIIKNDKELKDLFKVIDSTYIDKFMSNCLEGEVDILSDGVSYYYPAVIEQINKSGIHSGDSQCIIPSKHITKQQIKQLNSYIDKIVKHLNVKGILNIQFVIKNDQVYIIEINPRCSRTVPILSKVYNFDMISSAVDLILGKKIKDIKKPNTKINYFALKTPVFPWNRFIHTKPVLGPEMHSTGEYLTFYDNKTKKVKIFPI